MVPCSRNGYDTTEHSSAPVQDDLRRRRVSLACRHREADLALCILTRAESHLRRERREHTLQATALIHEAFLRLVDQRDVRWQSRAHFYAISAELMRRILIDHARARQAGKRGGGMLKVSLDQAADLPEQSDADLVALDDALKKLAALDPRAARVVELRCFGGLSVEETGEVLNVSPRTVKREWRTARAWLHRELKGTVPPET